MGKKKDRIKDLERQVKSLSNTNARLELRMEKMVDEFELALIHEAYADLMRPLEDELRRLRDHLGEK